MSVTPSEDFYGEDGHHTFFRPSGQEKVCECGTSPWKAPQQSRGTAIFERMVQAHRLLLMKEMSSKWSYDCPELIDSKGMTDLAKNQRRDAITYDQIAIEWGVEAANEYWKRR